ncbi:MAG TPA: hypothetical protein VJJ20_00485 [Candidatus Paceibacterota bacterium]
MKTSTIVAVLVVLLAILGGWYASGLPPMDKLQLGQAMLLGEGVACTADAMQCPDGSYVGRSGPNCEFVCPAGTTTQPTGGADEDPGLGDASTPGGFAAYNSGIRGTVMAGPTCPVERDPPDPQCADKPLATTVAVSRAGSSQVFATTKSDAQGVFEFSLPPGSYVVSAGEGTLPRCNLVSATIGPSSYTSVSIECDTGIR